MAEDVGNIGGLLTPREDFVPNLQSAYGAIIQNAPDYQYFTAPLSNLGNATAMYGGQNNLVVAPDTPIRVVNNATGEVIYSGVGYEGAQAAIDAASALSASAGNKANWDIQITRPGGSEFESVSTDRPNSRTLGLLADIALPIAGSFLPGVGNVLGAALGSGVSSVAQGRNLQDTLLRAGLAAGGSYLGGQVFGGAGSGTSSGAMSGINADLIPNALSGLNFGSIASTAIHAGVGGAVGNFADDILVNAIRSGTSGLLGSAAGAGAGAALSNVVNAGTTTDTSANLKKDEFGNTLDNSGAIIATAGGGKALTAAELAALAALGTGAGAIIGGAAGGAGGAGGGGGSSGGSSGGSGGGSGGAAAAGGGGGVLGTGLTLGQIGAIAGIGGSLLGGGGGGGGAGAGTPYVSPFGAGPAIGGADFRVNPNIQNYEQYGFGPEATFFRPEYNRLVSSGSMMGYTPTATTQTTGAQTYTPLIGGTTVTSGGGGGGGGAGGAGSGGGGAGAGSGGGGAGGAAAGGGTKQERPAGFTGVVSGQQIGDTQVVDGTTWQWGGDNVGWQMQYKDPTTGQTKVLPGNGATNVSSFRNNPTVSVNQPYFAQNTAIPGWATTYQGFQQGLIGAGVTGDAKAAAERELFTAIETMPFANATELVDYAKGIYNKYTGGNVPTTAGVLQAAQTMQQQAMNTNQAGDANQALATSLLNQAANYVAPNGFTPPAGTVLQSPEWDKLWLDYVSGRSTTRPPRLVGNTPEEFERRLQNAISMGPDIAQQTVDYWAAVRGDPRYAAAAQYEMTTGESAGGGPYLPPGYAAVGNSVMKIGTPQYEEAMRGLI